MLSKGYVYCVVSFREYDRIIIAFGTLTKSSCPRIFTYAPFQNRFTIDLVLIFIFRPHSASGCFQTGYVYKGQPKFDGALSSTCPTGPPKGAEWFHVKLTVSTATPAGEVKVYMKGALVTSWSPRKKKKNRGGVLVANGYKNVVYYKNFHIQ